MTGTAANAAGKPRGRPFTRDDPRANRTGRPQGSRPKAVVALDALAEGEADAIVQSIIAAAKGGDMRAAELICARIWPPRRGRRCRSRCRRSRRRPTWRRRWVW